MKNLPTIPAVSVSAVLSGLEACGVSVKEIRERYDLGAPGADGAEQLPNQVWETLWQEVLQKDGRPELPTRAALRIPFGSFGIVDYLAGSSENVGGGLQSLADHFSAVATGAVLEFYLPESGMGSLRVVNVGAPNPLSDEFTVSVTLGRFREVSKGQFVASRVFLTCEPLPGAPHEALLGAPVEYRAEKAGFDFPAELANVAMVSSNAGLHATLAELAKKLGLGQETSSALELSIRARLRALLCEGHAEAARVARALGMSERSLHRKLAEQGIAFQEVLDSFRTEEAEKLILADVPFAEIALTLGFSDQSAWTRSFKRTKGQTPRAWRTRARVERPTSTRRK